MVAKKTAAEKTAATKAAAGKTTKTTEKAVKTAVRTAAKKAPAAKKATAKKTAVKKAAVKKAAAKKATAKNATAKKTAASRAVVDDTPAAALTAPEQKTSAKKTPAKKTPAKKAPAGKAATEKTGARTVAAKKTAGGVTTAGDDAAVPQARAGELAVRPGEEPWTPEEVAEARSELQAEALRLRNELVHSKEELTGLMRDSGDGAGDDQADTGTKNITREHELALAANAREMLEQTEHALERLDAGTYGLCEVCGKPIGKARMQAFPRATLCVEDKQKQERRG
ncbi:TraR/DksA family transcriptional regulator [Streptomyces sp. NPDC003943]